MLARCITVILVLFAIMLSAQEQLGLRLENYAGISSVSLNPALPSTNRHTWDFNLGESSMFFTNSLAYFRDQSVLSLLKNRAQVRAEISGEYYDPTEGAPLLFDYISVRANQISSSVKIMGPSLMLRFGEIHTVGVYATMRAQLSNTKIPKGYNYNTIDTIRFGSGHIFENINTAAMYWGEVGLNYSIRVPSTVGQLSVGASAKYLIGFEGIYLNSDRDLSFTYKPGSIIDTTTPTIRMGFTNTYVDGTQSTPQFTQNGKGFSVDVGVVQFVGDPKDYQWKFAASITDIGRIGYDSNVDNYKVDVTDAILSIGELRTLSRFDDVITELSNQLYNSPDKIKDGNQFGIWLPAAINLCADYRLHRQVYINALLVQSLPLSRVMVRRDDLVGLTLRYESRWFSASLPVSVVNYQKVNLGAAIRLGYVVLGTDNLLSFFKQSKLKSADAYVALKINPFTSTTRKKRRKKIECYYNE